MKKALILLMAAVALFASCKTNDKKSGETEKLTDEQKHTAVADSSNFTTIQWLDSATRNLGELVKDQTIEVTFRFKNTGDKNLIFENVSAGCGCTIPEKPEKPYAPGEEGVIKAKYNGSGKGTITKTISVRANTKPSVDHVLTFTGEIKE